MVDSGRAAGTTAVVSIHEEKNKEVEIPRYDPKDKRKLWISKVEIHHNTMMEKIRGLVQQKLVELVMSDDDFFAGIEDVTVDLDDLDDYGQNEKKPETEEDILLAKKAKILQDLLNAIMELPKDEILSFLTSSSLPNGLGKKSLKSSGKQREQATSTGLDNSNARISASGGGSEEKQQLQQQEPSNDAYNWILDCGDAWKELPPVVRVNAIELGYNEVLWDEDVQDLPVFLTFWNKLTSGQRTAATFLGYNEHTWNEDARILVLGGKKPSLASLTDDEGEEPVAPEKSASAEKSKMDPKEDATVATTLTEMSVDQSDNDDDDDIDDSDDEDMFNEFVSNFASEIHEEQEANTDAVVKKSQDEDEDAMMDEFLANFGGSTEEEEDSGKETTIEREISAKTSSVVSDDEEDSEAMMDEFLANFGDSDDANDDSEKQPSPGKESSTPSTSEEDEGAMMDEFLANFGDYKKEEEVVHDTDSGNDHAQSHIPNYDSMPESNIPDDEKYQDEEQPLVFKPKQSVMDRGFQGEASPLLPSSTPEAQTKIHKALEPQKPDEPLSTWETVASYLYWVPVVVGLPVLYMMASGSKAP